LICKHQPSRPIKAATVGGNFLLINKDVDQAERLYPLI